MESSTFVGAKFRGMLKFYRLRFICFIWQLTANCCRSSETIILLKLFLFIATILFRKAKPLLSSLVSVALSQTRLNQLPIIFEGLKDFEWTLHKMFFHKGFNIANIDAPIFFKCLHLVPNLKHLKLFKVRCKKYVKSKMNISHLRRRYNYCWIWFLHVYVFPFAITNFWMF